MPDSGRGQGSIALAVISGDFVFVPEVDALGNGVPLQADGDISLAALDGSFGVRSRGAVTRQRLQDGLTFRSTAGNILLDLKNGFEVTDVVAPPPFTLDARRRAARN